jgi:hypothetical protein
MNETLRKHYVTLQRQDKKIITNQNNFLVVEKNPFKSINLANFEFGKKTIILVRTKVDDL